MACRQQYDTGIAGALRWPYAFAAADPAFAILDANGRVLLERRGQIADFRYASRKLRLSADAAWWRRRSSSGCAGQPESAHAAWRNRRASGDFAAAATPDCAHPIPGRAGAELNHTTSRGCAARRSSLYPNERSRSLAFVPGSDAFALGTEWNLRFFAATGRQVCLPRCGDSLGGQRQCDGRHVVAG